MLCVISVRVLGELGLWVLRVVMKKNYRTSFSYLFHVECITGHYFTSTIVSIIIDTSVVVVVVVDDKEE